MPYCKYCGQRLFDNAKFCENCGNQANVLQQREQFSDGKIHKCPFCGEPLNSFSAYCPACNHELRDIQSAKSVQELARKLNEIEAKRPQASWKSSLLNKFDHSIDSIDQQKADAILNFPIPNTKEDIQEFLLLASTNMRLTPHGSQRQIQSQQLVKDAWKKKYKQAKQKAKLCLGEEANSIKPSGFSWKKVGWIILNIYLIGIPALIVWVINK